MGWLAFSISSPLGPRTSSPFFGSGWRQTTASSASMSMMPNLGDWVIMLMPFR